MQVVRDLNHLLLSSHAARMCEIVILPNKGRGLVAKRDLQRGQVVLNDSALAIVCRGVSEESFSGKLRVLDDSLLESQVSRLAIRCVLKVTSEVHKSGSSETWNRLRCLVRPSNPVIPKFSLSDVVCAIPRSEGVFSDELLSQLVGILHLNVIGLEEPKNATAIFLAASMINHSW